MPARGLFGYEVEWEWERGSERETVISQELLYGITPDLAVTVRLPYASAGDGEHTSRGFRDLAVRVKWRFFRRDFPGGSEQVAVVMGVSAPTGNHPPDTWGLLLALTGTHSFGRWYLWGDARGELFGERREFREDSRYAADVALGWRPYLAEYHQLDVNPVLELNATRAGPTTGADSVDEERAGDLVFLSPGVLVAYRRCLWKFGVQFPIDGNLGPGREAGVNFLASFEVHF
jgi:hypothetical protein